MTCKSRGSFRPHLGIFRMKVKKKELTNQAWIVQHLAAQMSFLMATTIRRSSFWMALLSKEGIITERDHLQETACGDTKEPPTEPSQEQEKMLLGYMSNEESEGGLEPAMTYRQLGTATRQVPRLQRT